MLSSAVLVCVLANGASQKPPLGCGSQLRELQGGLRGEGGGERERKREREREQSRSSMGRASLHHQQQAYVLPLQTSTAGSPVTAHTVEDHMRSQNEWWEDFL